MDTFGFTQKKFLSLPHKSRHGHIIAWLSQYYQKLLTGRISQESFNDFCFKYESVLTWMDSPLPPRPENSGAQSRMEYVSDAVHTHRQAAGMVCRDELLLPRASFSDKLHGDAVDTTLSTEIILALDGLRSLFNVGSIFRTCDGAGVREVILGNTPGKENPRVQKTAMGSQKWIAQEKTRDLGRALLDKKKEGYKIIGVETAEGSIPCHCFAWPEKMVLVFGNEEYGISSHVMSVCDEFIHIPMFGRKNSLNVANAVSVVLFQARLNMDIS
ncbi:RNA methyltransferase [Desulfospira joergensenii]|uniref:RNA methyltransferase n=1 Tax=Desulfospira joergensenii TaxID=53329 RepID=UPI0003B599DA|nr:RNA methyltransferase [Desulfospira joergensenii]